MAHQTRRRLSHVTLPNHWTPDLALVSQQVEALFAGAPMGFMWLDRELRFLRINEWLAATHGRCASELIGKAASDIVPALEHTLLDVTSRIIKTGQPVLDQTIVGQAAHACGNPRIFSHSWYPVRNEHAEIIGFGATVLDITERTLADAAQRLKNERFELAVKASRAVLWQQDLDMRFTWLYNPAPGIDGSHAVGKLDADLLERAEDAAVIDHMKREVIRSGVGIQQEFHPHIQGVVHSFEVLMEPLRDAAGNIVGLTGAAIDITERKREEAARHESDQFYRALAEASLEIPYRMSADWSAMLPLDSLKPGTNSGKTLTDWAWMTQIIPADEHARVRQAIQQAVARQGLFEMEHRVLRPDGSTGWVRSRAVPLLDESRQVVAWFGAASDITARKRIEQSLIDTTLVAEKANRAKSDFLSSMSHEFRTPLNAILGFAQLMESASPEPSATQKQNLEHIIKGGWYLLALINELLDLAQIESGTLSVEVEPFSLAEVMLECQELMETKAGDCAVTMTFHLARQLGDVRGDRMRVKQVVLNLLSNAVKYNRVGGAVTVNVEVVRPNTIRIAVADTGEGLTPEKLAQLFQPFNRLGKESGPVQGTGIGLVMSKRLVEMMGGTIGVDSTPGVGSVFWFELALQA